MVIDMLSLFAFLLFHSIDLQPPMMKLAHRIREEKKAKIATIIVSHFTSPPPTNHSSDILLSINLSALPSSRIGTNKTNNNNTEYNEFLSLERRNYSEFALKLIFNAITTGACVQKGRTYQNTMINLALGYIYNGSLSSSYHPSISIKTLSLSLQQQQVVFPGNWNY